MTIENKGPEESYIDGMIQVYNDEICEVIDNYNGSAYYEPSYVITRAYIVEDFRKELKPHLDILWR